MQCTVLPLTCPANGANFPASVHTTSPRCVRPSSRLSGLLRAHRPGWCQTDPPHPTNSTRRLPLSSPSPLLLPRAHAPFPRWSLALLDLLLLEASFGCLLPRACLPVPPPLTTAALSALLRPPLSSRLAASPPEPATSLQAQPCSHSASHECSDLNPCTLVRAHATTVNVQLLN